MAVAFLFAFLAAGRSYLVCRMTNTVLDACCSGTVEHERCPAVDVASCCEIRTHAAPGDATQPVVTALLASNVPPAFGAPVAVMTPALASHVDPRTISDWTGPPLDEQRARLSVFLL